MTDHPTVPANVAEQPAAPKSAQVLKLLGRSRGATLGDIVAATGWQPHTVRAHLTRLRKTGRTLERMERKFGPDAYHLVSAKPAEAKAAQPTPTEDA